MRRRAFNVYPLVVPTWTPADAQPPADDKTCIECANYAEDSKPTCRKYQMSVGSALMGYKDGREGPCGPDRRGWSSLDYWNQRLRAI